MSKLFKFIEILDNKKTLFLTAILFYFLFFIFVFTEAEIIKWVIFLGLVCLLFVCKKQRIYIILLSSSFSMGLIPSSISIGSLFTWLVIFYYLLTLLDVFRARKFALHLKQCVVCLFTVASLILSSLVNFGDISINNIVSSVIYLILPLFFIYDFNSEKDLFYLLICLSFSLFFSNLFGFFFIYILKSYAPKFLELFAPRLLHFYNLHNDSYRFAGLNADPNYNSFFCLFIGILCFIMSFYYLKSSKRKTIIIISGISLQIFALLGSSKSYLFSFLFAAVIIALQFAKKKKLSLWALPIFMLVITISITPFLVLFETTFLRLINLDTRTGFLSALTTGRSDLFLSYLSNLISDPIHSLFGHGPHAAPIQNLNDMHNTFLRVIWDFGLLGFPLYFYNIYCILFPINRTKKDLKNLLSVFAIILIYCFALDLTYQHVLFISFFVIYAAIENNNNVINKKENINIETTEDILKRNYYEIEI